MKKDAPVIALAGNPNVGKTTLFNALTGSHQTVGNWPGVTVEHKQGFYTYQGKRVEVIDLPGIYSLSAATLDEKVARDFLLQQKPDLVINILDASNLERNLYLTVQLIELEVPMLVVLSMLDIAEQNGISIDQQHLEEHLNCKVWGANLNRSFDNKSLYKAIDLVLSTQGQPARIRYDEVTEAQMFILLSAMDMSSQDSNLPVAWKDIPPKWLALRLLERDAELSSCVPPELQPELERSISALEKHRHQSSPAVVADDRYGYIRGLIKDVSKRKHTHIGTLSDRIDRVILNGWLGLPVFFAVMFGVFMLAVRGGAPFIRWIGAGLDWLLVRQWGSLLQSLGTPVWLKYLLSDALGGGIRTVGTFVPPVFFIFLSLSILEDSGYMARAAFIADRFLRRIGLPGKAFIPLLVGFGCTVPAIMATRTLESRRDRIFASLLTPFMSCGAKLPVYTYLALLFFPRYADLAVMGLYLTGAALALAFGLAMKKTVFRSAPGNFVMELPPYHLPTLNAIAMHTWHRLKDFILRAGKTILLVTAVVIMLQFITIPGTDGPDGRDQNVLQLAGKAITPILAPMGIRGDNWGASVALISGLFAKEAIVGSLQSLYSDPRSLASGFGSNASAIAYLLFILLYSPCAAALTVLSREHGAGWMAFAFIYLTAIAWMVATVAYNILAFGPHSPLWLGFVVLMGVGLYFGLDQIGRKHAAKA
jgi:ferrous iron transport protein B